MSSFFSFFFFLSGARGLRCALLSLGGARQRPKVVHTHLRLRAPVTFLRIHGQHESRLESKDRVN